MPYVAQVAVGKLEQLKVFGNDYPTKDGTGVRDYIHVVDLAEYVRALEKVLNTTGADAYNLGTGRGYSVLEMVKAFEKYQEKKCRTVLPPGAGRHRRMLRRPGKSEG